MMDIKDYIILHTVGNLYWKDTQGKYLGCNKTFADLIGLKSPEEIIGKTDSDLFLESLGEEKLKAILELDQEIITTQIEKTVEEIGIDNHRQLAYYITTKMPLKEKTGKVIGLIGTSINITKQKQAELIKSEFLMNMSHDLRTPFTGILSMVEYLYFQEADLAKKANLSLVLEASKVLLTLLNQLLELSTLGRDPIKLTSFDMHDIIDELYNLISATIREKQLTITIHCPHKIIVSDRLRITRILLNIIGNAIKFTSHGKIDITVLINASLIVVIEDTGIGISQDQVHTIFDMFSKVQPSYKTNTSSGAGIGLYIAKKFAQELGGDIFVESVLGKGSTFHLMLPLKNDMALP